MTRDINPEMPAHQYELITTAAQKIFAAVGGTGCPRLDFLHDNNTGKMYLNEVNPCPGSFGYFLWEASANPVTFTGLLSALVNEACQIETCYPSGMDPVPPAARLLSR